jgi:hypothetical protein
MTHAGLTVPITDEQSTILDNRRGIPSPARTPTWPN